MTTLFLAWRQEGHRWWPVGRLSRDHEGFYEFGYTKGALEAERDAGFSPILSFPNFESVYRSDELFPMFSNRLLAASRAEYGGFMQALDLPTSDWANPLYVLARSEGRRMTDTFEVFSVPERTADDRYLAKFFVHGLQHQSVEADAVIASLRPGDRLELEDEVENVADPHALRIVARLRGQRLGYVPRYLCEDIRALREHGGQAITVTVERINPSPTPKQFRMLCRLNAPWPDGYSAFSADAFAPIAIAAV